MALESSDETVVREAVPDVRIGRESYAWQVYSDNLDGEVLGWDFRSKSKAWENARQHPIVEKYESENVQS